MQMVLYAKYHHKALISVKVEYPACKIREYNDHCSAKESFSFLEPSENHFASLRTRNNIHTIHETPNTFSIMFKIADTSFISMSGFVLMGTSGMIM